MGNSQRKCDSTKAVRVVFVINDYFSHGGHVKSFLCQFLAMRPFLSDFHIISARDGFVEKNLGTLSISPADVTTVGQEKLRKWQLSYELYVAIKSQIVGADILHVYSSECYFSALLAKMKSKVALVHSVMGGPEPFPCLRSTGLYIAVSSEQRDFAIKSSNVKSSLCRAVVIKNRIDTSRACSLQTEAAPRDVVLVVTRFDVDKLPSLALAKELVLRLPKNIRVVFAGNGELQDDYRKDFQDAPNVEFLGYCENLNDYTPSALVVLGMGRSILEFMLNGVHGILVGFNGIQLLEDVESVAYASDYNFAGRSVRDPVTAEFAAKRILAIASETLSLDMSVVEFLKSEYDSRCFLGKYLSALGPVSPLVTPLGAVIGEYCFIMMMRLKRVLRKAVAKYGGMPLRWGLRGDRGDVGWWRR